MDMLMDVDMTLDLSNLFPKGYSVKDPNANEPNVMWSRIRETILAFMSGAQVARITWNDAFADMRLYYNRVGEEQLHEQTKQCLLDQLVEVLAMIESDDNDMVHNYVRAWWKFYAGCEFLDRLFIYSLGTYTKFRRAEGAKQVTKIRKMAMEAWKAVILDKLGEEVVDRIIDARLKPNPHVCRRSDFDIINSLIRVYHALQQSDQTEASFMYIELISTVPCRNIEDLN